MADIVEQLGYGGQTMAEVKLGWARTTIRLGQREKQSGIQCIPAYNMRGRKPVELHLPNLLKDIKEIVDEFSQTDPQFRNKRLYTRLTVKELRHQLITCKGYSSESLPGNETLRLRMNQLGSYLEGSCNDLAAFGYNRDRKEGKERAKLSLVCCVMAEESL